MNYQAIKVAANQLIGGGQHDIQQAEKAGLLEAARAAHRGALDHALEELAVARAMLPTVLCQLWTARASGTARLNEKEAEAALLHAERLQTRVDQLAAQTTPLDGKTRKGNLRTLRR